MHTDKHCTRSHHWLAMAGLLPTACLLSGAALAQRPSIAALQSQIATLQSQVASGTIPNVSGYVTMDISTPTRPILRVAGANLQVVNGLGATSTVNGLGNVVVGYDEARSSGPESCTLGEYVDQPTCIANGGTWALSYKTGSHNLVVGEQHDYSRDSGFLAGYANTANGHFASVSGGSLNVASANAASVSGGNQNHAVNAQASVSGGQLNVASGAFSTVSGGFTRTASTTFNWVGGSLSQPF